MPPLTNEARKIKTFRQDILKLQLIEFCEQLEVSPSLVSKIENGERGVSQALLKKLHDKFKMNYDWFYTGAGTPQFTKPKEVSESVTLSDLHREVEMLTKRIDYLTSELETLKGKV